MEKGIVVVAKGGQDVAGLRRERSTRLITVCKFLENKLYKSLYKFLQVNPLTTYRCNQLQNFCTSIKWFTHV